MRIQHFTNGNVLIATPSRPASIIALAPFDVTHGNAGAFAFQSFRRRWNCHLLMRFVPNLRTMDFVRTAHLRIDNATDFNVADATFGHRASIGTHLPAIGGLEL
jgi:hypothetical protein